VRPTPALAYRIGIAAACVVAALRLLPFLGDRVMHRDEALAVMVARRPIGELLETVQLVRGGAPLHFLLAKGVAEFGGGLVATRAVSALGLLLAIVGAGLLGRALAGPVVGVAAAWMLALSPVALYYGDFARMYSLFLAFTALALWCLVRALDTGETRYWAGTAALLVANTYTHPYGVVVGLVAALAVVADLLQVRERAAWLRASSQVPRRSRSAISSWPRGSTRCPSRPGRRFPSRRCPMSPPRPARISSACLAQGV
jgi:predicted membrane-bound mannosyltransferase